MIIGSYKIFGKRQLDSVFFNRTVPLKNVLLNNLKTPVIFDVGANVGQTTLEFKSMFPGAVVHCFEPLPEQFKILETTCSTLGCAFAHNVALSDESGVSEFYANTVYSPSSGLIGVNNHSLSVLRNVHPKDGFASNGSNFKKINVLTETLDRFTEIKEVEKINLLKLDTQGAELKVLKGATRLLSSESIDIILTEISLDQIYLSRPSFGSIEAIISPFGYSLWDISHIYKDLELGRTCWVDAIYVSHTMLKNITAENG